MSSPAPEHPSSRRTPTVSPLLIGLAAGLALAVCGVLISNAQMSTSSGLRPGAPSFAIYLLGSWLLSGSGSFVAAFAAIQVSLLLRDRREAGRRGVLLRALALELDDLHAHNATRRAVGVAYRDPVRLTVPARLLDGPLRGDARDRDLLGALLALQAAIGRYNDLVLTNALVLTDGGDARLGAIADDYWRAIAAATQRLRPHLSD